MDVLRIAAFCNGTSGGNPAGVVIEETLPNRTEMQLIAADVGFSETVFAAPKDDGWTVRYYSPESEVPFCGHATIALGAALAMRKGDGLFPLSLSSAEISVEGQRNGDVISAALQSPSTSSISADPTLVDETLNLFGYKLAELDNRIPPAIIRAGATHLVLTLSDRSLLSAMNYELSAGRELMNKAGLNTISLIYAETGQLFHARNPFASGGVFEDPATGAAAAALAGYLRDLDWPHNGVINIVQGEDMGMKSLLRADIPAAAGSSVRVSGTARMM
ncbi:MAG: PhzF family phenazine biosynthesis protein [Gammaproteobacteria bacterium]|nr:PhzF family phenazine biosynthesis protein [Gammaproteobacteria bacterium]